MPNVSLGTSLDEHKPPLILQQPFINNRRLRISREKGEKGLWVVF